MAKLSIKKAEAALRATGGVIVEAARVCGVSRPWFDRFMRRHPELMDVRDECFEELMDVAEDKLRNAIHNGELRSVRWFLETRGRGRGYVRREERSGPNGEPLQFEAIERVIKDPKPYEPK